MTIKDFKYKRKDGEEKDYSLLVLNEDEKYLKGISLSNLKDEEVEEVKKIVEDFEAKLKPYMKGFRQYIKENIT